MADRRATLTYAADELRAHWDQPDWWRERLITRVNGPVQRRLRGDAGVDVMAEDWDTLLLFDACRADLFEAVFGAGDFDGLDGFDSYRRVVSRGSMTREWVRRNFAGRGFGDTVYVTANPLVSRHAPSSWHRLVETWRRGFDSSVGTVPPGPVVEDALAAHAEHPDKRLVVHFVQPHAPFLWDGPRFHAFDWGDGGEDVGATGEATDEPSAAARGPKNIWEACRRGLVPRDEVMRGYRENLAVLEPHVDRLLDELDGKFALTSDHGNALGERSWPLPLRVYGHPPGLRHRALVEVPWATVTRGPRRRIRDGGVRSASEGDGSDGDDGAIQERLAALGYAEGT